MPRSQGKEITFRHCQVHVSQSTSTKPGNSKPMSPLLNTPKAQAKTPLKAQPTCGRSRPCSNDQPRQKIATLIQLATSMSWLTYCPPMRNARLLPSIQTARCAKAGPPQRRATCHMTTSIKRACNAGTQRKAQAWTPSTAIEVASSQ